MLSIKHIKKKDLKGLISIEQTRLYEEIPLHLFNLYPDNTRDLVKMLDLQIDWFYMSRDQILSEPFIEHFQDKVVWCFIFKYQKLSESFKARWEHKLNL